MQEFLHLDPPPEKPPPRMRPPDAPNTPLIPPPTTRHYDLILRRRGQALRTLRVVYGQPAQIRVGRCEGLPPGTPVRQMLGEELVVELRSCTTGRSVRHRHLIVVTRRRANQTGELIEDGGLHR